MRSTVRRLRDERLRKFMKFGGGKAPFRLRRAADLPTSRVEDAIYRVNTVRGLGFAAILLLGGGSLLLFGDVLGRTIGALLLLWLVGFLWYFRYPRRLLTLFGRTRK